MKIIFTFTISLFLALLLIGNSHAQVNVFISGGLSTNTVPRGMYYGNDKKLALAPVVEIGFFNNIKSIKLGLIARYGSLNIQTRPSIVGAQEFKYKREELVRNMFSVMFNVGQVFEIKRITLSPSAELGLALNEKKNGLALGIRLDATYRLTKNFGVLLGTNGTMYKIKDDTFFYFPLKAGVAISFS